MMNMDITEIKRIDVCGVHFHPIARDVLHDNIARIIRNRLRVPILHVNVHAINLAQDDPGLRGILNSAPLVFCDGFGVRLGARLLGHRTPPRITYADWIYELSPFCEQHGFSLFLLGGRPWVAEQAAHNLTSRYPRLRIVGAHHGYFAKDGPENDQVIDQINAARPDVLIVAFGMPLQEKWIHANIDRLDAHVILSGGACLDYVAGTLRRGPPLLVNHGFEWLARLLIEPRRLWSRYLIGNPLFLWRVLRQRLATTHKL